MICPKCGAMIPDGRKSCINCGNTLGSPQSDPYSREERVRRPTNYNPGSYFETKPGVILMGVGESFIGLLSAGIIIMILSDISLGLGLGIGFLVGLYGVGLPLIGTLLIGIGQYSLGGNLLIAGSVLFIPIGRIGISAGRNAKKLEGWNPY